MKTFLVPFAIAMTAAAAAHADVPPALIEVTATAEKSVDPDMVSMNVEVWSKAATANRTQSLAAEKQKAALAVIEQFKIKKEDVQTVSYDFGPEYTWDAPRNQNRLMGFRSTQTLRVTLRKLDQAGKLIDALTESEKGGASPKAESGVNVNSIQWDSSKKDDVETTGLADAVKAARRKADEIAKAAGVRIKGVYRLSHASASAPIAPRAFMAKNMMAEAAGGGAVLSQGQVKVQITVGAEYEIAD